MSLFGVFNFVLQGSQRARLKPRRPVMANPVFIRYVLKLKIGRFPLRALRPIKPRRPPLRARRIKARPPLRAPRRIKARPPLRAPRRIKARPPLRALPPIKPRRPPPLRILRRIKRALRRRIIRNIRIVFLLSYITWISPQPCSIRTFQSFVNTWN